MSDLPEKHDFVIFIIRFKSHYLCNIRFIRVTLVILAGELERIKRQNALLKKIQISFGKVSGALSQWKERLYDLRRKPGSHSHDGDNDKPDLGTAEAYGRDDTGIAGTGQATPVFSGAETEFKKLKQ